MRAAGLCSRRVGEGGGYAALGLANNLANMPMRDSGDRGTAWVCVEASAASQARLGQLKIVVPSFDSDVFVVPLSVLPGTEDSSAGSAIPAGTSTLDMSAVYN